ncbi:MAG: hypothetical protein HYV65_03295 [Candidatus Spechtbacteria bacterium]|nr:hypothetical protein [Candidatus Spechtbacteria bacterium]
MLVQQWSEVVVVSLQQIWQGFMQFVPSFLGAIIVFIVGWIIAVAFGMVVTRLLQMAQLDKFMSQLSVTQMLHRAGMTIEISSLLGMLVKWFFVIAFFMAAVEIMGLTAVATFLQQIVLYIPNIVVAALVIVVAAILGDFLEKATRTALQATELGGSSRFVGLVTRWAVWAFGILAALNQLGVATAMVNTLFMGIVAMLALASGLAFGLGGQGVAREILEGIKKDING